MAAVLSPSAAEIVARIASGFDVNASAGYLDAQYTQLDPQLATLNPPLTVR